MQNFASIFDITDNIISVKQSKNLEQISVQNLIIDENRGKIGIYLWTNLINGKTYVGSSINLSKTFLKYFNEYCLPKDVTKRKHYYLYKIKPAYNILKVAGSSQEYIQTNEKSNG